MFLSRSVIAVGGTSVYRFSADGKASLAVNIAGASDLNGVALFSAGTFLDADDSAATVWKVDVNTGTARAWLTGGLLVPPPNGVPIGPNGVKLFRGAVYISNTGAGTLLRVPIMWDGSAGTPEVYASSFQVDDFAFGSDGSIFAATQHGNIGSFDSAVGSGEVEDFHFACIKCPARRLRAWAGDVRDKPAWR